METVSVLVGFVETYLIQTYQVPAVLWQDHVMVVYQGSFYIPFRSFLYSRVVATIDGKSKAMGQFKFGNSSTE